MQEILNVYDFFCDGCEYRDIVANLSRHCNLTPSDEIKIKGYLKPFAGLTFPKVVHATHLDLGKNTNTSEVFPDLKTVNFFEGSRGQINDFGRIIKINYFKGMQQYLDDLHYLSVCKPLGDKMYRFTSDKGSWDIKVVNYN